MAGVTLALGVAMVGVVSGPARGDVPGGGDPVVAPLAVQLGLPEPGHPVDVESTYGTLLDVFFDPHPEQWGGAYVDGDVLVVNTVTRSVDEATKVLAAAGVTQGVRVQRVGVSLDDLQAATEQLAAAKEPSVASVGPDYSHSRVVVGISSETDQGRALATGAQVDGSVAAAGQRVTVATGVPVTYYVTAPAHETSRYYETTPFYGGSAIALTHGAASSGDACSAGFAWNPPSSYSGQFVITASHCARDHDGTHRNRVNRVDTSGAWKKIGKVKWTSGSDNGTKSGRKGDVAAYKLKGQRVAGARIYTGTYNTSSSQPVKGYITLPQGWHGSTLYTSGAAALGTTGPGQINPDWVSLVNQTINYTGGQTYNSLTVAEHNSSCVTPGDSGGAFYQKISSGVYAVGIISGTNGKGGGVTNCRSYYTPVKAIVNTFGGSVKHG